jgi:hypothetical protein
VLNQIVEALTEILKLQGCIVLRRDEFWESAFRHQAVGSYEPIVRAFSIQNTEHNEIECLSVSGYRNAETLSTHMLSQYDADDNQVALDEVKFRVMVEMKSLRWRLSALCVRSHDAGWFGVAVSVNRVRKAKTSNDIGRVADVGLRKAIQHRSSNSQV